MQLRVCNMQCCQPYSWARDVLHVAYAYTRQGSPCFIFWRSLLTFLCNVFPEHLIGTSSDVPGTCCSQQRFRTLSAPMRMMTVRRPGVFSGFSAAISDTSCPGSILSDTCAATEEDTLRHSLLQAGEACDFQGRPCKMGHVARRPQAANIKYTRGILDKTCCIVFP